MIRKDGSRLTLYGPITMATVAGQRKEVGDYVITGDRVVDLSGVTQVDSAALALLLSWARAAISAGRQISIEHTPSELISLAALYGIDAFFPLTDGPPYS